VNIAYIAPPTLSRFHHSAAFYRFMQGPVGSGKSTGCSAELMRRAAEQVISPDERRHTRFAIIRNTYRELEDTTVKTWLDWWPESVFGRLNKNDMTQTMRWQDVEAEILFRALDRPDDIKKLLSLELTGAWVNEVREMPKSIIDALGDRVGRYPAIKDGGCTWRGVIGDTNPPDEYHWIYLLAEEDRPEGWAFFKQPGGLIELPDGKFIENPDAENIANLEPHYYLTRMAGKAVDHIRVYYCGQYGFVKEGKPVIAEYVDAMHCSHEILRPIPGLSLMIGIDFGLTPAATFGQRMPNGRLTCVDELVTEDMGAVRFGELLKAKLLSEYAPWVKQGLVSMCGDPAGEQRVQTDERTPFQILNAIFKPIGIIAKPARTNDFTLRREAIAVPLSRLIVGKPGLIISPKCTITRKGLAGGYCYKRVQVAGQERYQDKPDKNKYSHPVESLGYMLIEAGEGDSIRGLRPEEDNSEAINTALAQAQRGPWGGG